MESQYTSMEEEDLPSGSDELKQIIKVLQGVVKTLKADLKSTFRKLEKAERKTKKLYAQNDDLQEYNKKLGRQLHKERNPPTVKDACVQTSSDLSNDCVDGKGNTQQSHAVATENGSEAVSPWPESRAQGISIAESLEEAANEALQESGVVFDDNSGMYYDYNTGYYFDPDRSLYYEPHSGTYYFYNSTTGNYEFHSQIDVSQPSDQPESSRKDRSSRNRDSYQDQSDGLEQKRSLETKRSKGHKRTVDSDADEKTSRKKKHKTSQKKKKKHKKKVKTKKKNKQDKYDEGSDKDNDPQTAAEENCSSVAKEESSTSKSENEADKREEEETSSEEKKILEGDDREEKSKEVEEDVVKAGESEMEEGELSTSTSCEDSSQSETEEETPAEEETPVEEETPAEETSALYYPPCIRAMVTESDCLDVGTLFLVTLTGTTIGRDDNLGHGILIPDEQVSKMHADITYSEEHRRYTIKDHASQNGTFINDFRISESKVMSEAWTLSNMDVVRMGGTSLKLHIHPGQETCDDCEPGIVQAKVLAEQAKETVLPSKEDREKQRRKMLNQIKKKYGLKEANYTDEGGSRVKPGYEDKAAVRRKTKGSDNPYQKDDMPASVNRAISAENKGHKLLAKMGWKEGTGLGRTEQGLAEPIQVFMRAKQSAGLGSSGSLQHSLDAQPQQVQQSQRWLKAQERFMALTGVEDDPDEEDTSKPASDVAPKAAMSVPTRSVNFVQGQTLIPDNTPSDSSKVLDET